MKTALAVALAALLLAPALPAAGDAGADAVVPAFRAEVAGDPHARLLAFVSFDGPLAPHDLQRLDAFGARPLRAYPDLGVVLVAGRGADLLDTARVPGVVRVGGNDPIAYHLDTATVATRAREAWDARSTSTTPVRVGGVVVDGTGVGVAVVDSGVDATHPDLASAVAVNKKFVCTTPFVVGASTQTCFGTTITDNLLGHDVACAASGFVDAANTDTTVGHGTHVAGIVAGRGVASDGRHTGAAPGATLYALGAGETDMLWALESLHWVLCNHDRVSPRIRVVTNSWGGPGEFDVDHPVNRAVDALVAEGVVVVFSAGNDGGDGSENVVSTWARNPTRGVIGVANYDDADTATRAGALADGSSRGCRCDVAGEDWPDVAAPGTAIYAPRAKTGAVVSALGHPLSGDSRFLCCSPSSTDAQPYYVGVSGTSMAAPHVAGIVALLLQAKPSLTPAEVEDILEDSATAIVASERVADPTNPGTLTHHAAGHGLVDAIGALSDPRVGASGGSPLPRLAREAHVYARTPAARVDGQVVAGLQWTVRAGADVDLAERNMVSGGTPLAPGTPFRFVVDGTTILPASAALEEGATDAYRAEARHAFAAGAHAVEAQVLLGSAWRAFDGWTVTAR